jgi:acyl-CoA synthetase (NDP forming)
MGWCDGGRSETEEVAEYEVGRERERAARETDRHLIRAVGLNCLGGLVFRVNIIVLSVNKPSHK